MNKTKLDFILTFADVHVPVLKVNTMVCDDVSCEYCEIYDHCLSSRVNNELTTSEVAYLKIHYPEYFI